MLERVTCTVSVIITEVVEVIIVVMIIVLTTTASTSASDYMLKVGMDRLASAPPVEPILGTFTSWIK